MDISNIISLLGSKETVSAVAEETKTPTGDVKSVLDTVVSMAGNAKSSAPDLSKLTGTAASFLAGGKVDAASLLSTVAGKASLADVAKKSKISEGIVKKILDAAAKLLASGSEGKGIASAAAGLLGKIIK